MHMFIRTSSVLFLCFLAACLPASSPAGGQDQRLSLTVGGKNFTEQYLLSDMVKQLLEKNGFNVKLRTGIGTAIARQALVAGQIDLYYEYTGTAYTVFFKQTNPDIMNDPIKIYQWVRKHDAKNGLVWLDPVNFNNTYTIMMSGPHAHRLGIDTVSDFAEKIRENPRRFTIALAAEFWERPDGFKKLMNVYEFRLPISNIRKMDMGLTYMALKEGEVDAAMGFATDGRVSAFGLVNLEDDKRFFPAYNPAPVIRESTLNDHPQIRAILLPLAKKLTTEEMRSLNAAVDVDHRTVHKVVREWLGMNGLL